MRGRPDYDAIAEELGANLGTDEIIAIAEELGANLGTDEIIAIAAALRDADAAGQARMREIAAAAVERMMIYTGPGGWDPKEKIQMPIVNVIRALAVEK